MGEWRAVERIPSPFERPSAGYMIVLGSMEFDEIESSAKWRNNSTGQQVDEPIAESISYA